MHRKTLIVAALALASAAPAHALAAPLGTTALEPGGSWQYTNGAWHRLNLLGELVTGWYQVGGAWYWSDASGAMATKWALLPDGNWYWFGSSGALKQNTWLNLNNTWYYLQENGVMARGWRCIYNTWYYFSPGGAMLTGWQYIDGTWYYFDELGHMCTGWQTINGRSYFFHKNTGAMMRWWLLDGGEWYYLDSNGALQRNGWVLWNGEFFYVTDSGAAAKGWYDVDGTTYYFHPDTCVMAHDEWAEDRYLTSNGTMLRSELAPNGELVGADGLRVVVDPATHVTCAYEARNHGELAVWYVNPGARSGKTVYYLHGGSFDCGINGAAWEFADSVAKACDARVVVAAYPLAPWVTYETAWAHVLPSVRTVMAEAGAENVTLMGDSAGGGFAAGIAAWMHQQGETAPSRLVLISPWLDVTCSSPEMTLMANRLGFPLDGLAWEGYRWAGDGAWEGAASNARLCPLYGDTAGIRRAAVVWGTNEVFAGDAQTYTEKLRRTGAEAHVVVGVDKGHDWALTRGDQTTEVLAAINSVVQG